MSRDDKVRQHSQSWWADVAPSSLRQRCRLAWRGGAARRCAPSFPPGSVPPRLPTAGDQSDRDLKGRIAGMFNLIGMLNVESRISQSNSACRNRPIGPYYDCWIFELRDLHFRLRGSRDLLRASDTGLDSCAGRPHGNPLARRRLPRTTATTTEAAATVLTGK